MTALSYHQIALLGLMGPHVFHYSDSTFLTDQLVVIPALGLSVFAGASQTEYVIFTQTRAGNDNSWDWFIKGPMKEFVIELCMLE
jgi:hypothetical protein